MNKLALASIPAAAFTAYAAYENLIELDVRRERLGGGVRIAHISDLHKRRFGRNNYILTRKIAIEKPDLIFITGDMISRSENRLTRIENMLRELVKIAPVYIIFGNHEQSLVDENISAEMQERLIEVIRFSGAILLRNQAEAVKIGGRSLNIVGYEPEYSVYKKGNCYRDLDIVTVRGIKEAIGECPAGETLLLTHNPLFGRAYAKWGADYTFCGHVHGGSLRLFGKGIFSPERRFLPKYSKGVYTIGNKKLLVSAGIGRARLFNPPEVVIYDI